MFLLSYPALALDDMIADATNKATEIMEQLSTKKLVELITANLVSFSKSLMHSFVSGLSIILISSFFGVIKTGFSKNNDLFELVSVCAAVIIVFSPINACFSKVQEHIEAICGFMISLIPTCVMLHTASGNTLSAALMSQTTSTVITIHEMLSVSLILPLSKSLFTLCSVNTILKNQHITSITNAIKSLCLWAIGLSFTLFTGILSLQSILQSGADNLTMKGLKYGAAKLIPIAGGMISESMKTVITCVGYIKSVTGVAGIVFILYALIPPLCFIILFKIYLSLLSASAKVCNTNHLASFLDTTNNIINILLAALLNISVSLVIILSIFIKSTVSI